MNSLFWKMDLFKYLQNKNLMIKSKVIKIAN
jgi:hypothetical protein